MEKNYNNQSKTITVSLSYNNAVYQFNTEIIKPIELFYNEVCNYLQINPNRFNLHYDSKNISIKLNPDQKISEIISDSSPNSMFKIVPKKTKTMNLRYKTIEPNKNIHSRNNDQMNQLNNLSLSSKMVRNNIKSLSLRENIIMKTNREAIGAIITKFPSVQDVEKILKDFNLNNIHFPEKKGLLTNIDNNSLRVDFNKEAYLNEFINYISFIKYENPHYKKISIKKDVSNINGILSSRGSSNKALPKIFNTFEEKYDFQNNKNNNINNNPLAKSASKNPKYKLKIKIDDVIKALKQNELNKDSYHGLSLKRDGEDEIVTDYYQQQSFLRNSSPYINEHEKQILEEKENKKHFFKHKNFATSVGKYSMKPNFIPNYVGLTPGENPKNHEFREVDKNKWMSKKGFNI
jgi:hypothetical protein